MSIFEKKPNRRAQAVATGVAVTVAALATSLISIPTLIVGGVAWWATGKVTEK